MPYNRFFSRPNGLQMQVVQSIKKGLSSTLVQPFHQFQ
jgi:hypothetical protein